MPASERSIVPLIVLSIIVVTALIYLPGLSGSFLLDDIINLSGIAELSDDLGSWLSYLSGGVGASGRPLSYLSFALQHDQWPAPFSFKLINVILHIANGILVFVFLGLLLKHAYKDDQRRRVMIAGIVALVWVVHPLQVSTVLYVVQRMTILASMFSLIALITWLYAVRASNSPVKRYSLLFLFGLVCIFGVMSKENAALIPLYIILMEWVFKRHFGEGINRDKHYRVVFLWLPLILIAAFFTLNWEWYFVDSYQTRSFDLLGRIGTQPGVITDYLQLIVFPFLHGFRLFYENYPVSEAFLSLNTLLPLAVLVALFVLAVTLRHKATLFSFGILFFFSGHVLESTALPLELYFEHRNYLPSLGVILAFFGLLDAFMRPNRGRLCGAFTALVVILLGYTTFDEARLWGNPINQAISQYERNPTSHRAHGNLGAALVRAGRYESASVFYKDTIHLFPDDITKPLLWAELHCVDPSLPLPELDEFRRRALISPYRKETYNISQGIIGLMEQGRCNLDDYKIMLTSLVFLKQNENYSKQVYYLDILLARLHAVAGNYEQAIESMMAARELSPRIDVNLGLAQLYHRADNEQSARKYFNEVREQCPEGELRLRCIKHEGEIRRIAKEIGFEE